MSSLSIYNTLILIYNTFGRNVDILFIMNYLSHLYELYIYIYMVVNFNYK